VEIGGFKVASFFPGRVKLKLPELQDSPDLAARLEGRLITVPGIRDVEARAVSGSLLVRYDARRLKESGSLDTLQHVLAELFPQRDVAALRRRLGR